MIESLPLLLSIFGVALLCASDIFAALFQRFRGAGI